MKIPSLLGVLTGLAVGIVVVIGCLMSFPLSTWLWWAVPPLELYYLDPYYHATMEGSKPSETTTVQWLYKSGPDRRDEIATESDVVAVGPGNVSNYRVPMQLSAEARKAGWTTLVQGPRNDVKAAKLETYLRSVFYSGRNFWRLFEPLLWGALFLLFASLGVREWISLAGRKRHAEGTDYWTITLADSGPNLRAFGRAKRRLVQPLRRLLSGPQSLSMRRAYTLRPAGTKRSADYPLREGTSARPNIASEVSTGLALSAGGRVIEGPTEEDTEPAGLPPLSLGHSGPRTGGQDQPSGHPRTRRKRHLIFPGKAGHMGTDERPADWDESQWID